MSEGLIQNHKAREMAEKGVQDISAWGKACAMLLGVIAANVLDVAIGGLALSLLLREVNFWLGAPYDGVLLGFTGSLTLLFVQYVLWDRVLKGGLEWKDAPAIIFAAFILFLDSNLDISPIVGWLSASTLMTEWATMPSPIPLWSTLAEMTMFSTVWAFYLMLAFGELFTALYVRGFVTKSRKKVAPMARKPRAASNQRPERKREFEPSYKPL